MTRTEITAMLAAALLVGGFAGAAVSFVTLTGSDGPPGRDALTDRLVRLENAVRTYKARVEEERRRNLHLSERITAAEMRHETETPPHLPLTLPPQFEMLRLPTPEPLQVPSVFTWPRPEPIVIDLPGLEIEPSED